MTPNRATSLLVAALVLSGCDHGGPSFTPFLSFSYSGAAAGTFNAAGTPPANESSNKAWAVGIKGSATASTIAVVALMPTTGGTSLVAGLEIPAAGTGTLTISPSCGTGSTTCGTMGIVFGFVSATGSSTLYCALESGSIVVTKLTAERAAGTFSGTGTCTDVNSANPASISVADGSFEVALMAGGSAQGF